MKSVFRRHPVLVTAFAIATALTLLFAGRSVWYGAYWHLHANEPVRPWMTVRYVAHSWGFKSRQVGQTAGLPRPDGPPLTLAEVAAQRGVPVEQVITQVEAAIAKLQADRQNGTGDGHDGHKGGGARP